METKATNFKSARFTGPKRRIIAAYLAIAVSAVLVCIAAMQTVRDLVLDQNEGVLVNSGQLLNEARLAAIAERITASARGFVFTGDGRSRASFHRARARFAENLDDLKQNSERDEALELIDDVAQAESVYSNALERLMSDEPAGLAPTEAKKELDSVQPLRDALDTELMALRDLEQQRFDVAVRKSALVSSQSIRNLIIASGLTVVAAIGLAIMLIHALRTLARREADLDHVNRDLDAFAGRIAHDLKNALGPLSIAAESLSVGDVGSLEDLGALISRRVHLFSELVDDLLAFSRAGQPDRTLAARMKNELEAVVAENSTLVSHLGVTLDVSSEDLMIACAPSLLHMIVGNLLGNALKFLHDRPERRLGIRATRVDTSCELVVEDSGPGIPEAALDHIFEPFFRVPGAAAPGTGIGLATVQRIVHAHDGSISVTSAVGRGTRFVVLLPLADSRVETSDRAPAAPVNHSRPTARL